MTKIKVKGLNKSKKFHWNYEVLQWLAYVDNWDRAAFKKDIKEHMPADEIAGKLLILSWWVANRTCQDTLKFNYSVYCEPGLGHYVVAELAEYSDRQFHPMFSHWSPSSQGWEPWNPRASSTKYFVGSFNSLEEAENEAWCLDEAYFREDEDE